MVGSTPPESDAFWITMKGKGFEVFTYERRKREEKAVDGKIIAEGVSHIVSQGSPAVLNLLSGDYDMSALVEKALEKGWNVVLWSWKDSFSNALNIEGTEVRYLDDIADSIVYFSREVDGYQEREYLKDYRERKEKEEQEKRERDKEEREKEKFNLRIIRAQRDIMRLRYLKDRDSYFSKVKQVRYGDSYRDEISQILEEAKYESIQVRRNLQEQRARQIQSEQESNKRSNKRIVASLLTAGIGAVVSVLLYKNKKY